MIKAKGIKGKPTRVKKPSPKTSAMYACEDCKWCGSDYWIWFDNHVQCLGVAVSEDYIRWHGLG